MARRYFASILHFCYEFYIENNLDAGSLIGGQRLELGPSDFRDYTRTSIVKCLQWLWAGFYGQGWEHEVRVGRRYMLGCWIIWALEGERMSLLLVVGGPGGHYVAVKVLFACQETLSLPLFQVRGISTSAKLDSLIISDILTVPSPTVPWESSACIGFLKVRGCNEISFLVSYIWISFHITHLHMFSKAQLVMVFAWLVRIPVMADR